MGLLGGVDQEKEERERPRCDHAMFRGQRVDFAQQIVERRSSGLTMPPGPRCRAETLHDLERFLSLEPLDDASERASQPTDIVVERKVLPSCRHGHRRRIMR
jgi:hypothetical protein